MSAIDDCLVFGLSKVQMCIRSESEIPIPEEIAAFLGGRVR